jgi:hypothetical protein
MIMSIPIMDVCVVACNIPARDMTSMLARRTDFILLFPSHSFGCGFCEICRCSGYWGLRVRVKETRLHCVSFVFAGRHDQVTAPCYIGQTTLAIARLWILFSGDMSLNCEDGKDIGNEARGPVRQHSMYLHCHGQPRHAPNWGAIMLRHA